MRSATAEAVGTDWVEPPLPALARTATTMTMKRMRGIVPRSDNGILSKRLTGVAVAISVSVLECGRAFAPSKTRLERYGTMRKPSTAVSFFPFLTAVTSRTYSP
jgi:hypothetical protein